ncbi:Glycosyltransferase 2-like domain-containing protein [Bordetella tumbae]
MFFRRRNQTLPNAESIACDVVRKSDLFDPVWYLDQYPDVLRAGFDPVVHYVRHGAQERRKPGPWFDTEEYLEAVGDGAEVKNPILHYLENRGRFDLKNTNKKREYSNLTEFLKFSALSPVTSAPFKEEDRRCFAVMEAIARYLVQGLNGAEHVKVSVIMPVRNRAQTLLTAIDSVRAQKYENFELIVIDDGSEDDSADLAELAGAADPRIRCIKLAQHSGVSIARNTGLAIASGSIIAYLDSDNTWLEDYLGAVVGAFHLLPNDVSAIYSGQYIYADSDPTKVSAVRFGPMNLSLLDQHNYVDLNCFAHRREVLEADIFFDDSLSRLVDWDFILRISESFRMVSIPVLLSRYYLNAAENTITKTVAIDPAIECIALKRKLTPQIDPDVWLFRKICVVIPSYRALQFLQNCVESLRPYFNSEYFEVVIVDNNSPDEVKKYLQKISCEKIKIVLNDVNYGFSYAVNQGVALASTEADILILNNDAELARNSLEYLQKLAYQDPDIAIAVPRQILPPETDDISLHVPYATIGAECDVTLSIHHRNIESIGLFHDGHQVELNFAPFFCAYIKRASWNACGGLDYINGRHYRSDRIMCDFVKQVLKQRIVYTPSAKVRHASQISTKTLDRNSGEGGDQYRIMLIKNVWPDDLKRDLKICPRPWDSD